MNEKKRERAINFQKCEVNLLTELITKYRTVLENKKTDAVTNKEKDAAWNKIACTFNAASNGGTTRSAKTLKLKYDSMKKIVKKKLSCHRQELYKTGGGSSSAPDLNEDEEKLVAISTNLSGLDARHDSDNITVSQVEIFNDDMPHVEIVLDETADYGMNEGLTFCDSIPSEVNAKNDDNMELINDSIKKWDTWKPKSLKSKISKELKSKELKANVTVKLDELTSGRLELVQLQQKIAQTEHLFIKEEHDLKMTHLHNEEIRKAELHQLMMTAMQQNDCIQK